jgi:YidC/Oxa1 family membrane protein insertase
MLLAIVLSVVILFGFQFMFAPALAPPGETPVEVVDAPVQRDESLPVPPGEAASDAAGGSQGAGEAVLVADVDTGPRLAIDPAGRGRVSGSIALRGGRIDDLSLLDYKETLDPDSARIELFAGPQAARPYYADFGWIGSDVVVPDTDSLWTADRAALSPGQPVTMTWDNGAGLIFERMIALDDDYMFTVTQRVRNQSDAEVTLYPYGRVSRTGEPTTLGFFILHEGPLGVFNGTLEEVDYDDLRETPSIKQTTTGGWIGITDKFWLAALVPDPKVETTARFHYAGNGGRDRFQVDYLLPALTIAPGASESAENRLFAGAKEVMLLDRYEEGLGIERFDLAVDFGWFYFLTKPIFYVLHSFYGWLGNFGLAILALTVIIKLLFFPLANKSYVAMSKLKKLQPQMMELRERFGDDKQKLNGEVMALYKREKANPLAGCLPIVVQIPVFFALYKVLFVSIEMRHAPFYGWVKDLSAPDPTNLFNLFGLLPFTPPEFLALGIWPLLMGLTMFLQQKLNPTPPDPMQARIMMMLPLIFVFLFATFPAGLVIYWTWNNVLSIAQQWLIMRRMGVKPG